MGRSIMNGSGSWLARIGLVTALSVTLAVLAVPSAGRAAGVTSDNAHSVSAYLMQRGIEAFNADKATQAIDYLEHAVVAHPKNARAFAWLGKSHERAGRRDRAMKHYTTALAIDPDDLKALQWAGEAALADGKAEDAARNLERLRRLCSGRCPEFRALNTAVQTANKPAQP